MTPLSDDTPMTTQDPSTRYARSTAMVERALGLIPLGTQTYSKAHWTFPGGEAPMFLDHGQGGRVWDIDGNGYIDLMGALLPILLGYRDPDVDAAIRSQLDRGILFSLGTTLEVELAERLVDTIPCAEMVRFAKTGTDAVSAAVRLARAVTGRDHILMCGYHGWNDWSVATTTRPDGIPQAVRELTHTFPFNDLDALAARLRDLRARGGVAAVVLEPVRMVVPEPGFLQGVADLARAEGALVIFDEIVTGLRVAPGGAQAHYGVTPDLACFGKGLGNGMPIAAVVGRAAYMRRFEDVFFSGTYGGEALSLAAALATLRKVREQGVSDHLWALGRRLVEGLTPRLAAHGLDGVMTLGGLEVTSHIVFHDDPRASAFAVRTVLMRELLRRGVLFTNCHGFSFAHTAEDVDLVLAAYDGALPVVAADLAAGDLDARLGDRRVRPVFPPKP